jgi:dTDP-glucose 4,6-dehydratase
MQTFELGSNYDPAKVVEICDANNVKSIVNFAAQSMVAQSWDSPWDWYQTNCVWLSRLTHELMKWGGLKKFVHYTTPEVYGSTYGWINEQAGINPTTPYAISRAAGDLHLLAEFRRLGFPVVFTRAANVYGPFQQRYRILPKALIAAATRQKIELHGGGHSERSFIFMEDVAHALLLILKRGNIGESYHISTQRLVTIRKAVEMCFQIYGIEPTNYLFISEDRPGKDKAYMLDSNKIRRDLGWVDNVSLEEGIKKTRQWVDTWLDLLVMEPSEYVHKV